MAKKMSKRKTNAIILGVTLTLVMVLLGGVIAAVVTETNPKDWFVKTEYTAPEYSELGEDMVKEYDAFYLDTSREGIINIEEIFEDMEPEETKLLAYIGDTSVGFDDFNGYMLFAQIIGVPTETGSTSYVRCITLADRATNESVPVWANREMTIEGREVLEGFQNLGEDGLLELDGNVITGAIVLGDDMEELNIISVNPVK